MKKIVQIHLIHLIHLMKTDENIQISRKQVIISSKLLTVTVQHADLTHGCNHVVSIL